MIELIPSDKYPILLAGFDIRRWEHIKGRDFYFPELAKKFQFLVRNQRAFDGTGLCSIGPSGIQYESPFGFQVTRRPFAIHVWYQFRKQIPDSPGSEIVFYWRAGSGRWDANMGGVVKFKFRIFGKGIVWGTWFGPGLRWD